MITLLICFAYISVLITLLLLFIKYPTAVLRPVAFFVIVLLLASSFLFPITLLGFSSPLETSIPFLFVLFYAIYDLRVLNLFFFFIFGRRDLAINIDRVLI